MGIHTSIFTEGVTVSCTLQNAGKSMGRGAPNGPGPPGGVNGPAGTAAAAVIVPSAIFTDARFSQDCAAKAGAEEKAITTTTTISAEIRNFLIARSCAIPLAKAASRWPGFPTSYKGSD